MLKLPPTASDNFISGKAASKYDYVKVRCLPPLSHTPLSHLPLLPLWGEGASNMVGVVGVVREEEGWR